MKWTSHFFFLLLIIATSNVYSQKFNVDHINYSHGLSSSNITTINQDRFGFIWLGTTHGGLYKWDGIELKPANEDLSYTYISEILITNDNKYVHDYYEIYRLDNNNQIAAKINMKSHFENKGDAISRIFTFKDKVIAFTFSGWVFILGSKDFEVQQKILFAKGFYNYRIIQSGNSFLLFNNTSSIKLFINSDNLFSNVIPILKKLPSSLQTNTSQLIYKYSILSEDSIFMQSDGYLFELDQNLNVKKRYSLDLTEPIYCLIKTNDEWWIGTANGLYRYIKEGNHLKLANTILRGHITRMLFRTGENIWAASMIGLFNIYKKKIYLIEDSQFEGTIYSDFLRVNNSIWALSYYNGINIFEQEVKKENIKSEGLLSGLNRCLLQFDPDSVYVGTPKGMFKLSTEDKAPVMVDDLKYFITSIAGNQDTLIVGTGGNGVIRKIRNKIKNFGSYNDTIKIRRTYAIFSDQHYTFASSDTSLFQLVGDSLKKIDLPIKLESEFAAFSMMVNERNQLLIGTANSGIIVYDIIESKVIEHIKTPELSSNTINFLRDIDGAIWVGTNMGVDILQYNKGSYTIHNLSDISSLGGAETSLHAVEEVDNKVWVGTIAGIVVIPKDIIQEAKNRKRNNVIIESVIYGASKSIFNPVNKGVDSVETLNILHTPDEITISFNSMNLMDHSSSYLYQLVNYDMEIKKVRNVKSVTYKRLPPGKYRFEVWEDDPYQDSILKGSINIHVIPQFYETKIFVFGTIALIILLAIIAGSWYLRIKKNKILLQERMREEARDALRNEIAIDFHDEMGNHLAKIINLAGVIKLQRIPEPLLPVVNRIEENAKKLFSSTTDLIWSLKSKNNNTEEIFFLIKDFTENLFEESPINLRFYNSVGSNSMVLNAKRSRDITLIVKELITNVYKHADAKNLSIEFKYNDTIIISIVDDGVGFCLEQRKSNGGISNIYQRANRSSLGIDILSNLNSEHGTTVQLKIL